MASRAWTPLGAALLCGHCALGALAAGLGAFGLASFTLFGVDFNYLWPPVAILGGFALYVWSGRERAAACALPEKE